MKEKERAFKIVTDSGCDMPKDYYSSHGVECLSLGFAMEGVSYGGVDGEGIEEKEFYERLRGGAMPTTYQVSVEEAKSRIEPYLKANRDVLCVSFSSGLSGTHDSFLVAAKELQKKYPKRKIVVVDSLCASMGEGLLLDYILKKADSGASIEETAAYAKELRLHILHSFTVDNLFHLKRGGRVSSMTAIVGSILKIKPVMHVDDHGKLVVVSKAMGRKKALATMIDNLLELAEVEEDDPFFISHGDAIEDAEFVKQAILKKYPRARIEINYIGAVIGSHAGAGTVAVFCKGKHR